MPGFGQRMPMGFFPFGPFMWLVFAVVIVVPFWVIFSKAGYSRWLSLLMTIPVINVIMLYVLAFSTWPSQRKP
jgi:type II secretory pathway component PulF